jgi:hypothetical protein
LPRRYFFACGQKWEKHEIRSLKNIILAYIVMLGTDTVWALTENGSISLEHYLNAAVNYDFEHGSRAGMLLLVQVHRSPSLSGCQAFKKVEILTAAPAAAMCALNFISVFTGWTFYISPNGEYMLGKLFWLQGAITFAYLMVPTLHFPSHGNTYQFTEQTDRVYYIYSIYFSTIRSDSGRRQVRNSAIFRA